MENTVNMFRNSEWPRSPTRLQRRAPMALNLDPISENPFLEQSYDAVASTAIPLLSPLFVSPSLPRERDVTEKSGSQESLDLKKGWQYSPKVDNSNNMALLNMFQTKLVLVDDTHGLRV